MARVTVADLRVDLARIEGKVDTFVKQMGEQDNRVMAQEGRLRKVENRQYYFGGFGAAIGAVVTGMIEYLSGHAHS